MQNANVNKRESPRNSLMLAAATAVLKSILDNGLVTYSLSGSLGGEVTTSALPPDRVTVEADSHSQLNLFLYQITQKGLGAVSRYATDDDAPSSVMPIMFELLYLVTAYGAQDLHAEILLGYALDQLNCYPCLLTADVSKTLASLSPNGSNHVLSPPLTALSQSEIGRRFVSIRISPQITTYQEMQNLWSSFQTPYRPSATYKVIVELIPAAANS
jgi:hypothetical protein